MKVLSKFYRRCPLLEVAGMWIKALVFSGMFVYFLAVGGAHEIPGWGVATAIGLVVIVLVLINLSLFTLFAVANVVINKLLNSNRREL